MSDWLIYCIGFLAQILFSSRLIFQWIVSEKQKKVTAPTLFWSFSLMASLLFLIYGFLRNDFAIILGQILTYFIYIRNLQLQNQWQKLSKLFRSLLLVFPVIIGVISYYNHTIGIDKLFNNKSIPFWLLVLGIISQIIFTLRFVYQWIYSEQKKASILPFGFWMLSIIGSILILIYAIIRKDPVLFIGHIFGIIFYIRNLILLKKQNINNDTLYSKPYSVQLKK